MSKIMELADAYAEAQGQEDINVVIATQEEFTKLCRARQLARAALTAEVEKLGNNYEDALELIQRIMKERDALREKLAAVEKDSEMLRAALEYVCNTCDWHGDDGQDAMRKAVAVLEATK